VRKVIFKIGLHCSEGDGGVAIRVGAIENGKKKLRLMNTPGRTVTRFPVGPSKKSGGKGRAGEVLRLCARAMEMYAEHVVTSPSLSPSHDTLLCSRLTWGDQKHASGSFWTPLKNLKDIIAEKAFKKKKKVIL